jgi:hypothetical protein
MACGGMTEQAEKQDNAENAKASFNVQVLKRVMLIGFRGCYS